MKKMRYSRRLILAAAIVTSLGVGAFGVSATLASQDSSNNGMSSLVEAIAEKFELKVSDVQAVFDEQRDQMQANREAKEAERLAQAVTGGKITQEQADAITVKREEIRNFKGELLTMDEAARQEAMKTHREEIKQWAEDNNIPMHFLQSGGPYMKMPGRGPGQNFGNFHPMGEDFPETN